MSVGTTVIAVIVGTWTSVIAIGRKSGSWAPSLGLLQFGLWYHAQHVVLGAAQDGAHAAARDGAASADGEQRAKELVRAGLGSISDGATVSAATTDRVATVRVHRSRPSRALRP